MDNLKPDFPTRVFLAALKNTLHDKPMQWVATADIGHFARLAFEHPAPLADRRAWVLLESPRYGTVAAEIELSWCRYNEGGRYTSGGRFVLGEDGRVATLGRISNKDRLELI